ncbi:Rv1733c family protein [Streptomyces sp. NPDC003832]
MALRGPRVWLWRWRRNPLKRRADMVESWVLVAAWALTVLVGVAVGLATAGSVERGLARERAEWRPVQARLTDPAPSAAGSGQLWARVSWTAPDGSARTGQARVGSGGGSGTTVTVWTDRSGRLVTRPATVTQAHLRAGLTGGLVGAGAAMLPFMTGRVLRDRMEQRRIDRWDTEWSRFGPLWGRTTG